MKISESTINMTANSYAKSETVSVKGEAASVSSSSASGNFDTANFSGTASYESDYVSYGNSVSYSTQNGKLQKNGESESFSAVSESIVVMDDETAAKKAALTEASSAQDDKPQGKLYLNQESFKLLASLIKKLKLFSFQGNGLNGINGLDINQMTKICIGTAQLKSSSGTTATATKVSAETTASSQTQGLDFGASGTIITDDGRQIDFNFDLSAISSSADSAMASGGALVYDKNGDGVISDSSELFGAKTGDGFAELAEYDDDGNGWIDEDDEIFNKLSVSVIDENGESKLVSLKEYGVGAIFTGSVNTSYTTGSNSSVSKTGIYLKEDGSVGAVNHINYKA